MTATNTATFKAVLPAGVKLQVVEDANGVTLIASANADTFRDAEALLASGFAAVQAAWQAAVA